VNRINKQRPANIGLAIWRLRCFYETFVQGSTLGILMNFGAKNPPHRQAENRYKQPMDSNNNEGTLRHKTKKPEIGLCLFWHISIFADTIRLHKEKCKRAKISLPFISPKKQSER